LWPRATPVSPEVYAARWPDKREDTLAQIELRDRAAWDRCVARFDTNIDIHDVLPGLPNCMNLRGDLNLVYCSASLQPLRASFDERFEFVGPCYDERSDDRDPELEAALAELPDPIVYASLGSIRMYNERLELFRTMLDALADGHRGVVMAVGSDELVAALGPAPNALIRAYVPQLRVLDRAALFVTHAGTNSVYEALLAGVPMLMLPQGGDQPIVAEQLERLGLGEWLRDPLAGGPARLRARVERMLGDSSLARAAAAAGEQLRRAGGTARAADLLSDFADRRASRRPCE
jgi:MGT family glycosyltransferase